MTMTRATHSGSLTKQGQPEDGKHPGGKETSVTKRMEGLGEKA